MLNMQVIGHLGRDVLVNQVNGKTVLNFNVAHSKKYKDAQGVEINHTVWVDCAWWMDRVSGAAQYLKQGTQVHVEGEPDVETYKNKTGTTIAKITLRVRALQLLGGAKETTPAHTSSPSAPSKYSAPPIDQPVDDLPF